MCKLAFSKTSNGEAYDKVVAMLRHQENVVAGHSTGIAWKDKQGVHLRKAVGKIINFLAEYPDIPRTNMVLGHSRYATVGKVNKQNQHPIRILYKGKGIGFAIHNGHWGEYASYEYLRNTNRANKTDSALIFDIYQKVLEKYGDSAENRKRALATISEVVDGGTGRFGNNFILMFDNGQVIFGGHKLTYKSERNQMGIMTFGFDNEVIPKKIYEVVGFKVREVSYLPFINFRVTPRPIEKPEVKIVPTCGIPIPPHEQTTLKVFKKIDKKIWKLANANHPTKMNAQLYGELLKKRHKTNYRVQENPNGKWSVYIRRKGVNMK